MSGLHSLEYFKYNVDDYLSIYSWFLNCMLRGEVDDLCEMRMLDNFW